MTTATVELWGTPIGYVSMDAGERFARFEYDPAFAAAGIEVAPLHMPVVPRRIYRFRELDPRAFHGLPGLLADSLPDKYGNRLIDVWLARTGRTPDRFTAVDRLCYTGTRGMGALEFEPSTGGAELADRRLEVEQLVELASVAFAEKEKLQARLDGEAGEQALLDILSVGTSAGGARAKAVIAFDPRTKEVRSGQTRLPPGFEHWLIKFDGVAFSGDWGIADPKGHGLLEYAYSQLAARCGVTMSECRLLQENGRSHFMTRRFDRDAGGGKRFVQTFGALAHYDYFETGAYSYEQLFLTMKQLRVPPEAMEQQFRRVVFNLVGCNQDDHVKNFAFVMDRRGAWDLAPAYDLCHAEGSAFTSRHQLGVNGKTGGFDLADLRHLADVAGLPRRRERIVLDEVLAAFAGFGELAEGLGVPAPLVAHVTRTLRTAW
ncbi:MAG TPA: type II toxin-antitoxin system HipA family toxin [Planctomycetota bacterium]|nr:type II toxin-antitoxin system HipA family toxin [Planctomycetota bacterium]